MNIQSPAISNSTDLVLQLVGGDRNGQLLPVSTAKCLLSSLIADKEEAEKYRCAIFRGEKGVAFRSYSKHVLVNGSKTSVQWLRQGDTIKLTPNLQVVVKELGKFTPASAPQPLKETQPTPGQGPHTTGFNPVAGNGNTSGNPVSTNAASGAVAPAATLVETQPAHQRANGSSNPLTSARAIASEAPKTSSGELSDQTAERSVATSTPLSDEKMADASSSIQDYLDKALGLSSAESSESLVTANTSETANAVQAVTATEISAKPTEEEVSRTLNRLLLGGQETPAQDASLPASNPITTDASTIDAPASQSSQAEAALSATKPAEVAESKKVAKANSIEFLKSLGIDTKDLGLGDETPAVDNTAVPIAQPASPTRHSDLASASLPKADEIIASISADLEVKSESVVPTEVEAEETVAEQPTVSKPAESVADVLARMQSAGSLDNLSIDSPSEEATSHENDIETETAALGPEVAETVVAQAVVAEATPSGTPGGEEDSSVEDYMSQLLNRMRGGDDNEADDNKDSEPKTSAPQNKAGGKKEMVEVQAAPVQQETLTAEQFIPKEKAVRMKSFDSLREIANNSNRLAIQDHLANQRQVSTQTKSQLALISLGFGVLFFLMSCVVSAEISVGGMLCGIAFLFFGVVFAKLYCDERKLDESIIKAQNAEL